MKDKLKFIVRIFHQTKTKNYLMSITSYMCLNKPAKHNNEAIIINGNMNADVLYSRLNIDRDEIALNYS